MLAWLLAGGLLPAVAAGGVPRDPPQGRFDEAWMSVMMGDRQLGYAHIENVREQDHIRSSTNMVFRLTRAGTVVEIRTAESYTETIGGQAVAFQSEMLLGSDPIRSRGTVSGGKVHVVSEQYGVQREQEVDYPAGALMPWAAYLKELEHELKPGTVIELQLYVPSLALNMAVPTRTEILGQENLNLAGQEVQTYRTRITTTLNNIPFVTEGWIDPSWKPLKQTLKVMGIELVMICCDKSTALGNLTPAEMFTTTLIPLGRSLDRDRARGITFRLATEPDGKIPDFPETDMQRVLLRKDNEVHVRVTRPDHAGLESAPTGQASGPELAPFLSPTMFITSDDAQVLALAKEAVGSETNPYRMADLLRRKVSETVRTVDLGTGFATAAEVCRRKEGDCTENGVLLAALGRAVGIPSRVVTGLIYVPGMGAQRDVMGFHMWAQLWIAGRWIDLDAAWDQTVCDPTHIALGTHSTQDDSIASLVSSVLLQVHELKISVLAVEE